MRTANVQVRLRIWTFAVRTKVSRWLAYMLYWTPWIKKDSVLSLRILFTLSTVAPYYSSLWQGSYICFRDSSTVNTFKWHLRSSSQQTAGGRQIFETDTVEFSTNTVTSLHKMSSYEAILKQYSTLDNKFFATSPSQKLIYITRRIKPKQFFLFFFPQLFWEEKANESVLH